MNKPYYQLDQETKVIIKELVTTCKKVNLGNINFDYYPSPNTQSANFHVAEYKEYWELVVSSDNNKRRCRDIYRISEDMQLVYEYSETDI